MNFLEARSIHKSYNRTPVLRNISLTVKRGSFVCLLGPSGCGKSTLLRIIAGLETPDEGSLFMEERDITRMVAGKRNFGMVFQSYALFPNLTVRENITFGLRRLTRDAALIRAEGDKMLTLTGLTNEAEKYPSQLSGGQQQRTALGRALILSPSVLLLDEPLSALDAKIRRKLGQQLKELQRRIGVTTIMVTHDQEEALTLGDSIAVMNGGVIEQAGTPEEVYNRPATEFVAEFIGQINHLAETDETLTLVRPEHLRPAGPDAKEAIEAVIASVSFCGSFYRLKLAAQDREYLMDLPAREAERLRLEPARTLRIRIPHKRRIECPRSAAR